MQNTQNKLKVEIANYTLGKIILAGSSLQVYMCKCGVNMGRDQKTRRHPFDRKMERGILEAKGTSRGQGNGAH